MQILKQPISKDELQTIADELFGDMVKAVVDVKKRSIAINAELHADLEALFLQKGSKQDDLWGINLYPKAKPEEFIEYTSLINIRPHQDNPSTTVEDIKIQQQIRSVVNKFIT